jgi:hypothetical protein
MQPDNIISWEISEYLVKGSKKTEIHCCLFQRHPIWQDSDGNYDFPKLYGYLC